MPHIVYVNGQPVTKHVTAHEAEANARAARRGGGYVEIHEEPAAGGAWERVNQHAMEETMPHEKRLQAHQEFDAIMDRERAAFAEFCKELLKKIPEIYADEEPAGSPAPQPAAALNRGGTSNRGKAAKWG